MEETTRSSQKALVPVRDTLDILNDKWKIPLIISLSPGQKRFNEIQADLLPITARMLLRELKELEENELVCRTRLDLATESVGYSLTAHGHSLKALIEALHEWGQAHRARILR